MLKTMVRRSTANFCSLRQGGERLVKPRLFGSVGATEVCRSNRNAYSGNPIVVLAKGVARTRRGAGPFCLVGWVLFLLPATVQAGEGPDSPLPAFQHVEGMIRAHFEEAKLGPTGLVTREDVQALITKLGKAGWQVEDQQEILSRTLPESHVLVKTLRNKRGQRFTKKASKYKLLYDRLERISDVPGGKKLLRDLMKLPDAHRYARPRASRGVPDLVSLLPKTGDGKKRRVKDYHQPTGNLYTQEDVLARLKESYDRASR